LKVVHQIRKNLGLSILSLMLLKKMTQI